MKLKGESHRTCGFSTTNPTLTGLGSNLCLSSDKQAANHSSHGIASKGLLPPLFCILSQLNPVHSLSTCLTYSLILFFRLASGLFP